MVAGLGPAVHLSSSSSSTAAAGGPLDPDEVSRLSRQWEEGKGEQAWRAAKELGLRLLNHGKAEAEAEEAVKWLQRATTTAAATTASGSSEQEAARRQGVGEAWYGLGLAYERADKDRKGDVSPEDEEEEEERLPGGPTYGARTGVEFVRIVRVQANKRRKQRLAQVQHQHRPEEEDEEEEELPGGVPVAHRRSLPCFEKAARHFQHWDAAVHAGNVYFELAHQHHKSPSGQKEAALLLSRAVQWWKLADEQGGGHGDAAFNLGTAYYDGGPGLPSDPGLAVHYLKRACDRGDASAAFWLGHAHRTGDAGLERDGERALSLLRRACEEQHHPAACYYLATLYREGDSEAGIASDSALFHRCLSRAVELQDPEATFCLADMLLHGTDGVSVDEARAVQLYERAGRMGHPQALVCLGALLHHRGLFTQAFSAYQRAAELGSEEAWRNLASMYALGQGVPRNDKMAQHIVKTLAAGGGGSPEPQGQAK